MNKKILIAIGLVVAIILLFVGYREFWDPDNTKTIDPSVERVVNDEYGVSFSYPTGEEGLTLIEPPVGENGILKAYLLMSSPEFEEYQAATEPREAPASVSVFIFNLEDESASTTPPTTTATTGTTTEDRESRITRLQNWALDNKTLTSFDRAKATPEILEIDGLKTLHYQADGLYQQDIYLATYRGRVYMFTAQYNEESDLTFTALKEMMNTVSFD